MKNTYVKCADWSWEDKLLYIKACIGDDMPHEKFCGNASYNKACLLERYSRVAAYIYCYSSGMISFDVKSDGLNLSPASKREVKLSDLKQEKPKPTKFVKVEGSIFDLKEEFERGELYSSDCEGHYTQLKYKKSLYLAAHQDSIYRQVEVDWRDEVKKLDGSAIFRDDGDLFLILDSDCDRFVSMCHKVAELTDKPE